MNEQVQGTVDVVELHAGLHRNPTTIGAKVGELRRVEDARRMFVPPHRCQDRVRQAKPPADSSEHRPRGASCSIHQAGDSRVVQGQRASEGAQRIARISPESTIELCRESVTQVHSRA